MLMIVFVVMTPFFPAISLVDFSSTAGQYLHAMTLPAVTLAIVMAVYAVRMLRDNLIEVLDSDYIRMAELKGVPARRVVWRHALPNALVPTLNVTALNLAYLIGGVVVVERVFSYPGFGSLLVDALQLRDLPLIEATVMIAAAVYIGANLLLISARSCSIRGCGRPERWPQSISPRLRPALAPAQADAAQLSDRRHDPCPASCHRSSRPVRRPLRLCPDGDWRAALGHELAAPVRR